MGRRTLLVLAPAFVMALAPVAAADHPVVPVPSAPGASATGALTKGSWTFIENIPNLGTDAEFFTRDNKIYGLFGTLTQGVATHAGQRIIQLAENGVSDANSVKWISDHNSANCPPPATTSATGIQHDVQITPQTTDELSKVQALGLSSTEGQIIIDSNDAPGRCHDPGTAKGGIEIVDVTDVTAPKEIGLVRTFGENHNSTVDKDRPWIIYSSSADPPGSANLPTLAPQNYIDIINIRSCFGVPGAGEARTAFITRLRNDCRPVVTRFQFEDAWTIGTGGTTIGPQNPQSLHTIPYACHDITYQKNRLYCAAINTTVILDVSQAFAANGDVKGTPLTCAVASSLTTAAKVTDCSTGNSKAEWLAKPEPRPQATGVSFVGVAKHAGRDGSVGSPNSEVLKDISISHESDPTPDSKTLLITDERGGGTLIPAASCAPGASLPYSNGGLHFYDISDPANPKPRTLQDGKRAVFIAPPQIPVPTFCSIHVIDQVPDENRLFIAWYTQGTWVLDFFLNEQGQVAFEAIGYWIPPGTDQWVSKPFLIKDNPDGGRTYFVAANNITRGIDVLSFTASKKNAVGSPIPEHLVEKPLASTGASGFVRAVGAALILAALVVLRRLSRPRLSPVGR